VQYLNQQTPHVKDLTQQVGKLSAPVQLLNLIMKTWRKRSSWL